MKKCFADTSYFLAILIPQDVNHVSAIRWAGRHHTPIITSEYIALEVGNFLSPRGTRHLFRCFMQILSSASRVSVIQASSLLLDRGAELYQARSDKAWSLTDCISFIIMRDHDLNDALTADHDFEQAGFNALLK